MKQLLNTLFVTSEDIYLSLEVRRPGSVWPSAPRTDVSLPAPAARAAATYCSVVSSTVSLTTPLAAVR